ncbi:MAG TPA: SpoIIE family protein phosphatase [Micromonosporaceae bacterium]
MTGPASPDDNAEELYEDSPCGLLSATLDGTIVKINQTLLRWTGRSRDDVIGRARINDLLTVGGRIFYETHLGPLLAMQGQVSGIALDLRTPSEPLPILVSGVVTTGTPALIRVTLFDARDRRAYEQELLDARRRAEQDHERLRQLNLRLQQSLLPPTLPTFAGVDLAAYYHMASDTQVGGDFYDVFPLPNGGTDRWGFLLGDVCGKGIDAAALTTTARHTLRASSAYAEDPAAGLSLLNTVLFQDQAGGPVRFCTALYGIARRSETGLTLRLAGGGHPAPLLIDADGSAAFHTLPAGPIIGALPQARYRSAELSLRTGETMLLYTDGITEARTAGPEDRDNAQLLRSALTGHRGGAGDVITTVRALIERLGDGVTDDVALLAMTVTG